MTVEKIAKRDEVYKRTPSGPSPKPKTAVTLSRADYERLLELLEDAEEIPVRRRSPRPRASAWRGSRA